MKKKKKKKKNQSFEKSKYEKKILGRNQESEEKV